MRMVDIALSGIQSARIHLDVMSMNLSNVLTPGYSRQEAVQNSVVSMGQSKLVPGDGVQVDSIRRIADRFLTDQLRTTQSNASYYQITDNYLGSLENVIGGDSGNIGKGLDNFFAALNALTTQPDSLALRQQLIGEAGALATRINGMHNYIAQQKKDIKGQRQAIVDQINTLTSSIADYNKKIREMDASGGNTNALRDQRDEVVRQLSELTNISVSESSDGYTVTMKSGQALVSGAKSGELKVDRDKAGNMVFKLKFNQAEYALNPSTGGKLGALYDYETGTLEKMRVIVDDYARKICELVNAQLKQGYDLNGAPGKALFDYDAKNPEGPLHVRDIEPEQIALSDSDTETGNNNNLKELIKVKDKSVYIKGLGSTTLNKGAATIISMIGVSSKRNKTELEAASTIHDQAKMQRDNLSGVNQDEEAINLQSYMQAYQANAKVIAAGGRIFEELMNIF